MLRDYRSSFPALVQGPWGGYRGVKKAGFRKFLSRACVASLGAAGPVMFGRQIACFCWECSWEFA